MSTLPKASETGAGFRRGRRSDVARGIVVARGYGVKVYVSRAHLVIEDGIGTDRQTRRFHRASARIKRLAVLGHSGYITFDALRWLHDVGAALLHVDWDGRLLTTSTAAGASVPALRRAQAMAPATSAGVEAARDLLRAKVAGQASLLPSLPGGEDVAAEVEHGLADIEEAQDIPGLLAGELRAAGAYWQAWERLPLKVVPRRRARKDSVPDHWRTFGARASLLTGAPRSATNPANALLNYLYTLLSAEAAFACHAVGLDPALGIFHMDRDHDAARAALAFDVMEACRPTVDAYVLALISERTLSMDQLGETREGSCRLASTLAAELAGTLPLWQEQVAPHTERVAHTLRASTGADLAPMTTPLTHANLIAAIDKRAPNRKRRRAPAAAAIPRTCEHCGAPIKNRRSRYCGVCARERTEAERTAATRKATRLLDELRTRQGGTGKSVSEHGIQVAAHHRAARQWTGERRPPWEFSPIREALEGVPVVAMAAATELSEIYCQAIRAGRATPHPRHWEALRELADGAAS
jgi:CRISPR-associated endonuclease Cas1